MSGPQWWVGGAGTQLYTAAANWSATRGGAGGNGPPIAGDTVYIVDGNSQIAGSDQSAVSLAALYVDFSPYGSAPSVPRLSIGTSGTPLKFTIASGGTARFTGGYGDMYLGPVFGGSTSSLQLLGSGNHVLQGQSTCGAGMILASGGKVTVNSDYGGSAFDIACVGTTVELSATALGSPPTATLQDGQLTSFRALSTTNIDGGIGHVSGSGAVSSVSVRPGAKYIHESSGTLTTIVVSSCGIAVAGAAPFTVTNSTVYGNGVLFPASGSITFTNPTNVFGRQLLYAPE